MSYLLCVSHASRTAILYRLYGRSKVICKPFKAGFVGGFKSVATSKHILTFMNTFLKGKQPFKGGEPLCPFRESEGKFAVD